MTTQSSPSTPSWLISKNGIVLRTQLSEIRETGRNTQGVILMNLGNEDEVAGIAIMREDYDDQDDDPSLNNGHESAQKNGNDG